MQERPGEQMEQMLPCFERPGSSLVASVFIVEAEVRLCLGKGSSGIQGCGGDWPGVTAGLRVAHGRFLSREKESVALGRKAVLLRPAAAAIFWDSI